ncbi:hypothetical protein DENSPDRAFT_67213 [Dentipellis sp. KUC8613]|nr:hypothetical protein DENSPDRAFT_67213 [Dentipellis sp. KUC8613]
MMTRCSCCGKILLSLACEATTSPASAKMVPKKRMVAMRCSGEGVLGLGCFRGNVFILHCLRWGQNSDRWLWPSAVQTSFTITQSFCANCLFSIFDTTVLASQERGLFISQYRNQELPAFRSLQST